MEEQPKGKLQKVFHSKLFAGFIVVLLLITIPLTVFVAQNQQQTQQEASAVDCNTPNNLIPNCTLEVLTNGFPSGWSQFATPGNLAVVDTNSGKAFKLGQENGACNLTDDIDLIQAEVKTKAFVGNSSQYKLSFDYQMKSKHTIVGYPMFFVFANIEKQQTGQAGGGKEIFLSYTPHNDFNPPYEQYCSLNFRSDYQCEINDNNQIFSCNDAFNNWKRITIDFTRQDICNSQECLANFDTVSVAFGVQNDIDTVVLVDNVVLTAVGVTPGTPVPTDPPQNPITPTIPTSPNSIQTNVKLNLPGATAPNKQVFIEVFNAQNQPVGQGTGVITKSGNEYVGTVNLGDSLPQGDYTLYIGTDKYLPKQIPRIFKLTPGQTTQLPTVSLSPGEIRVDGILNILDFNLFQTCMNLPNSTTCGGAKIRSDLNDDNVINILDYNTLLNTFKNRQGD